MKKMISKICLFLFIALIAVSCEDFPVDEDGLLITTRAECYVSNFDLYNTDHQTIKLGNAYVDTTAQVAIMYVKFGTPINNVCRVYLFVKMQNWLLKLRGGWISPVPK